MKKILLSFIALFFMLFSFAQSPKISIIPQPAELTVGKGSFIINRSTSLYYNTGDKESEKIATLFNASLKRAAGFELMPIAGPSKNTIHFSISSNANLGKEGYTISVKEDVVHVAASQGAGLFYAMHTLLQLLPKEIESNKAIADVEWILPVVEITDQPRFGWRGLMFDVSRHFFTVAQVKEFIEDMARYKYNLLHFHLTDDQGWRIEIKSLPKLTEVGAWNVKKTGRFNFFTPPADNEPRDFGGFYTQEDIKEIVRFAKEHYVDVMPEIDVPGHSLAAIASYPDLSCTPGKYKVNSGESFMNWYDDGTFSAMLDNTLCPANEKVYTFLDKVFAEVSTLFPFEYIHMGGDECAKTFWEKNPQILELMKREKLKDMHEVQSYFVGRVSSIINSKGKKMMGWDEILEGGDLPPSAAVMSWRGIKGGVEAAKLGHEVVMSPTTHAYLDYMQTDGAIEPPVYAMLRLKKAYEFEPVPDGVDPKFIKGGQANLWTEQIYNMRHLRYMVWPRAFATAEAVWSPKSTRNWNNFVGRVENHFERFDVADKKYAPSIYDPVVKVKKNEKGRLLVDFDSEIEGLSIHYSFDNSFPDHHYPSYEGKSIEVPVDAAPIKLISYRNGKPIGRMMTINMDELKKRSEKK